MGETIAIQTSGGLADAYVTGDVGMPGVLFYMDAIGLRPRLEEMADHIASWGYVVLVPNVFYRAGSAVDLAPTVDLRDPSVRDSFFEGGVLERYLAHDRTRTLADAPGWLDMLAKHARGGPIGVIGYCMGVRLAMWTAGAYPDLVAAVGGFHGGGLVSGADDSPHRSISASTAVYVFGHAEQDPDMPLADVAALEMELVEAGLSYRSEVYGGASHGYSMADTSAYHQAATTRHFDVLKGALKHALPDCNGAREP